MKPRDVSKQDAWEPKTFDLLPKEMQDRLLNWITENLEPAKTFYKGSSSYGLKHLYGGCFPHEIDAYVTSGEFIGAMLKSGYKTVPAPNINGGKGDCYFNITKRCLTKIGKNREQLKQRYREIYLTMDVPQ